MFGANLVVRVHGVTFYGKRLSIPDSPFLYENRYDQREEVTPLQSNLPLPLRRVLAHY
jgi:hypothetical protein